MTIKRISVAVGILLDDRKRVLVGQRVAQDRYFGMWEFPGGKLEAGESAEEALVREFQEEIAIRIISSRHLMEHRHDYPDRLVHLFVRMIEGFEGEIEPREGQALRWVDLEEIDDLNFLQGNQVIIERLKQAVSV